MRVAEICPSSRNVARVRRIRSPTTTQTPLTGCSSAWLEWLAWSKKSPVRIRPPRLTDFLVRRPTLDDADAVVGSHTERNRVDFGEVDGSSSAGPSFRAWVASDEASLETDAGSHTSTDSWSLRARSARARLATWRTSRPSTRRARARDRLASLDPPEDWAREHDLSRLHVHVVTEMAVDWGRDPWSRDRSLLLAHGDRPGV